MENALESRSQRMIDEGLILAKKKWDSYISPLKEAYKDKKKRDLPVNIEASVARCLENMNDWFLKRGMNPAKIQEDTYPSNVGSFIHYGFDMVTALIPTLAIEDVVSIQPMDRRVGEIFFLDFIKDTTKGVSTAGDSYLNSKTGAHSDYLYSTDRAEGEVVATGLTGQDAFTYTIGNIPLRANTITIYVSYDGATVEITDDGAGNLGNDSVFSNPVGTVNYELGVISIDISAETPAVFDGDIATADYRYNMDRGQPPGISLEVNSMAITAASRRCQTNWLLEANMDLEKAHGKSVADELFNAVVGSISNEISIEIFADILVKAFGTVYEFDKTPSSAMILPTAWEEQIHKHCVMMSNTIYANTRRGHGNVIVGGNDFCEIVEALHMDYFKPEVDYNNTPAGPHKIGVLGGRFVIIKNVDYPVDEFVMGFKGDSFLNAGYVYAPYHPLYVTNPVALGDTKVRRGMGTSSAKAMINNKLFAKGKIIASTP